eukprot:gene9282-biopygen3202
MWRHAFTLLPRPAERLRQKLHRHAGRHALCKLRGGGASARRPAARASLASHTLRHCRSPPQRDGEEGGSQAQGVEEGGEEEGGEEAEGRGQEVTARGTRSLLRTPPLLSVRAAPPRGLAAARAPPRHLCRPQPAALAALRRGRSTDRARASPISPSSSRVPPPQNSRPGWTTPIRGHPCHLRARSARKRRFGSRREGRNSQVSCSRP